MHIVATCKYLTDTHIKIIVADYEQHVCFGRTAEPYGFCNKGASNVFAQALTLYRMPFQTSSGELWGESFSDKKVHSLEGVMGFMWASKLKLHPDTMDILIVYNKARQELSVCPL